MRAAQRGQSLVEFALLSPLVVFGLFALIDLGVAAYTASTLTHGTQAAAGYASLHCGYTGSAYTTDQLSQRVLQTSTLLQATQLTVQATPADGSRCIQSATAITVTSTYQYRPLTPFLQGLLGGGPLRLQTGAQVLSQ